MTRSITGSRRAVRLAAGAAAIALALTGCSAGQIAETALKQASVSGVTANSADQKLAVRGLAVAYEGVEGYPAGASAPVEVALVNQTGNPITVVIGVAAPEASDPTVTSARQVLLTGGAAATPTASPSPSGSASPQTSGEAEPGTSGSPSPNASSPAPASASPTAPASPAAPTGQPARITIPASGIVTFTPESAQKLSLIGLAAALRSGMAVTLTFQVTQDGEQDSPLLTVKTPVAIPLTPAPRETGEAEEHHE